jgi:DNA-binding transcriptional ArsR family regulator
MSQDGLGPVIHARARLLIMVTLAALRVGDDLSVARLQDLIGLTPGNLITHLRKLEDAGYVTTQKNGTGVTARTSVALTHAGRAARRARVGLAQVHEQIEIVVGPVVRVYVDPHSTLSSPRSPRPRAHGSAAGHGRALRPRR